MSRFAPSRIYLIAAAVALGLAVFFGWFALGWAPAWIACGLFGVTGTALMLLALRPVIEVGDSALAVGGRVIEWRRIRRVDRTGWISPLVVDLTLDDESRVRIIYPGDVQESGRLFHLLRQYSTQALIDGVPSVKPWEGRPKEAAPKQTIVRAKVRLMSEEDEAEIERLYQKLKIAGRLDP
ncbi:MAG: DUF3093 family protein [Bryobacterales bacterium]|nr:DUF3093 family protein [Bryobacterales bacterium]